MRGALMWFLSRSDSAIVARQEVPGLEFGHYSQLTKACYEMSRRDGSFGRTLPRRFVPGYYHAVPAGQKPFAHRSSAFVIFAAFCDLSSKLSYAPSALRDSPFAGMPTRPHVPTGLLYT
jgi:hypothetical protein